MVDILKLRAKMTLKGYTQKDLVEELNNRGIKVSENTFSAKMNGTSAFDCDMGSVICAILEVDQPAEKAEIFLA